MRHRQVFLISEGSKLIIYTRIYVIMLTHLSSLNTLILWKIIKQCKNISTTVNAVNDLFINYIWTNLFTRYIVKSNKKSLCSIHKNEYYYHYKWLYLVLYIKDDMEFSACNISASLSFTSILHKTIDSCMNICTK